MAPRMDLSSSFLDAKLDLLGRHDAQLSLDGSEYTGSPKLSAELELELRRVSATDAKRYGALLFNALFPKEDSLRDGIRAALRTVRRAKGRRRLRFRLHLASKLPAELHALVWERLYDLETKIALAHHSRLAFSRSLSVEPQPPPVLDQLPRILAVAANPPELEEHDLPPIRLEPVFMPGGKGGPEQAPLPYDVLPGPASPERIHHQLSSGKFHILHLQAHGIRRASGAVELALEDSNGRIRFTDVELLNEIADAHDLYLATLICCHGAETSASDSFDGLASGLVERGIPAVLAFRQQIAMDEAVAFSGHFYRKLALHGLPELAVNESRHKLFLRQHTRDLWSQPILYSRLADGLLWHRTVQEPPAKPQRPAAPQGVAPQGVAPQGVAPQGVAPQGVAPQGTDPEKTPVIPSPHPHPGAGAELQPGDKLDHYQILGKLGQGAMGAVYRARDEQLDREVAVKVVLPAFTHQRPRLERFYREARAIAKLNHPNIVRIYEFGKDARPPYFIMELIRGEPLSARLRSIGREGLPPGEVVALAGSLLDAVGAAHEHGVIHRDLKPSNIMIDDDGCLKVLDFGLAKLEIENQTTIDPATARSNHGTSKPWRSAAGQHIGTPPYMSPEQLVDSTQVDARSDIFTLGVILFQMLTGRLPFPGNGAGQILHAIQTRLPAFTAAEEARCPEGLRRIVLRCLQRIPAKRFQTIGELVEALEAATDETPAFSELPLSVETHPDNLSDHRPGPRRYTSKILSFVATVVAMAALLVAQIPEPLMTPDPDRPIHLALVETTKPDPAGAALRITDYAPVIDEALAIELGELRPDSGWILVRDAVLETPWQVWETEVGTLGPQAFKAEAGPPPDAAALIRVQPASRGRLELELRLEILGEEGAGAHFRRVLDPEDLTSEAIELGAWVAARLGVTEKAPSLATLPHLPEQARALLATGENALRRWDLDEARRNAEQTRELTQDSSPRAADILARVAHLEREQEESRMHARAAREIGRGDRQERLWLRAWEHLAHGRPKIAAALAFHLWETAPPALSESLAARFDLGLRVVDVGIASGTRLHDARQLLAELAAYATSWPDPRVLLADAILHVYEEHFKLHRTRLQETVQLAQRRDQPLLAAEALLWLAEDYEITGEPENAVAALEQARDLCKAKESSPCTGQALVMLGSLATRQGRSEDAARFFSEAMTAYRNHPARVAGVEISQAFFAKERGELEESRKALDRAADALDRARDSPSPKPPELLCSLDVQIGYNKLTTSLERGDLGVAAEQAARLYPLLDIETERCPLPALGLSLRMPATHPVAETCVPGLEDRLAAQIFLSRFALERGQALCAEYLLNAASADIQTDEWKYLVQDLTMVRARALMLRGQAEEAEALLADTETEVADPRLDVLARRARSKVWSGDPAGARRILERANDLSSDRPYETFAHALAWIELELAEGRIEAAWKRSEATRAIKAARELSPLRAELRELRARIELARGRPEDARREIEGAFKSLSHVERDEISPLLAVPLEITSAQIDAAQGDPHGAIQRLQGLEVGDLEYWNRKRLQARNAIRDGLAS